MQTTRVVTPSSGSVLTLAEACAQVRMEPGMDDAIIQRYVAAASKHIEESYGLALLSQTKELVLDEWPDYPACTISLVDWPVSAVTWVKYTTSAGVETTWTDWVASINSQPVEIVPNYGRTWPSATLRPVGAIAVRYVAGWATASEIPEPIRQAVALLMADWYIRREDTEDGRSRRIPNGVHHLMGNWRT